MEFAPQYDAALVSYVFDKVMDVAFQCLGISGDNEAESVFGS